ncbi:unnamed protein product [Didymodactylos carnosus]|uniref:Uncharacterized protein n=1 Tax=Didymodactylos carnosus TaxID=1234261 RepID=A0A815D3B2_9BILA|nr:unnamed protein product [Didymodactylos carnosus]CAF4098231.1 unnamed protein product [Didymodactylos carnosus]
MTNFLDRCEGTFLAHAIADQLSAPTLMAYHLTQSLLELNKFDSSDVLSRYLWMYHSNKCDMGEIVKLIYDVHVSRIQTKKRELKQEDFKFDIQQINETCQKVDEKLKHLTSGINPAHRSFPIALCPLINDYNVFQFSVEDAHLTHYSPIAGQVSGIVNLICRYLIKGQEWNDAVHNVLTVPNLDNNIRLLYTNYKRFPLFEKSKPAAYAPNALNTALYCLNDVHVHSFESALQKVYETDKNYAPALVGILAGCRWGVSQSMLDTAGAILESVSGIRKTANVLAKLWEQHSPKGANATVYA